MLWKDQLQFVGQHIKKNKLRVFMTVLAATMGCAFLIVLASIGFGLQDSVKNEILSDDAITQIQVYNESLTEEQLQEMAKVEHVKAVHQQASMSAGSLKVMLEDRDTYSDEFYFTDFDVFKKVNPKLSEGRFPTTKNEIIVGYYYGQQLLNDRERELIEEKSRKAEKEGTYYDGSEEGYKESLVGKTVKMTIEAHVENSIPSEEMAYTIVGVLEKPSNEWAEDSRVLFNTELQASFKEKLLESAHTVDPTIEYKDEELYYTGTNIYTDTLENVKPVLEELKELGYSVYSPTEEIEQLDIFFLVLKAGLIFVGTIAVLIASIGIFNTMTMAVTERTREIGVLKAIGASPKLIQRLFLMESALIGVLGTFIAVVISYCVSFLANALLPIILEAATGESAFGSSEIIFSYIPWQLVVIASAISIGVAMVSGWRPARKATKIDVIQALRQEL